MANRKANINVGDLTLLDLTKELMLRRGSKIVHADLKYEAGKIKTDLAFKHKRDTYEYSGLINCLDIEEMNLNEFYDHVWARCESRIEKLRKEKKANV